MTAPASWGDRQRNGDGRGPSKAEPIAKRCNVGSAHVGHDWTYRAFVDDAIARYGAAPKRIDPEQVHVCPGIEHADHDERCCPIHGTHALGIHIGCVFR